MARRLLASGVAVLAAAWSAQAEPMRPLLTKENRLPEAQRLELGGLYRYVELTGSDEDDPKRSTIGPAARYGLTPDLAVTAFVPFHYLEPDEDDSEQGLGDVTVGLELRAVEDIFHYPWVMPHCEASLETGDEDNGLGEGESTLMFGLAVGSVAWDAVHFIADGRYRIASDSDNIASIAGSIIWDISDRFSVLAEAELSDREDEEDDDSENPAFFQGGMAYKATDNLTLMAYGGGGKNTPEDVAATLRAVYSF